MNKFRRYFIGQLNRSPASPRIQAVPGSPQLPKLIHQTFPSKKLPIELQASVDSLRALNQDWEHRLYDDTDIRQFIGSAYGADILSRFERIDPIYGAARADLFRYLLLYKVGGVYLDIKSAATRPLDLILSPAEQYIIAQWPSGPDAKFKGAGWHEETKHIHGGEFQQWFLVSTPGHPFLKAVIENVIRNLEIYNPALHGVGKRGVLRITGPIAYTLAIEPLRAEQPHRHVDASRDLGFEYSIYPTVDRGLHPHLKLFKVHYSQSTSSLVRLNRAEAVATLPLMAAERWARRLLGKGAVPP